MIHKCPHIRVLETSEQYNWWRRCYTLGEVSGSNYRIEEAQTVEDSWERGKQRASLFRNTFHSSHATFHKLRFPFSFASSRATIFVCKHSKKSVL